MAPRTAVISLSSDHEEIVERLAKHLGNDKLRRKLFDAVYGRARAPRSLKQIMADAGIKNGARQQAQNQIDHLQKHHLICRMENDGSVDDGSHYLYFKDLSVRAVRADIVRYADDPAARGQLPTKRRPAVHAVTSFRQIRRTQLRKKAHLNVLYLTADPDKSNALRVDAEVRCVQEAIRASEFRDSITLDHRPAAGLKTLLSGLNERRPQVVHFSGHGNKRGIAMDNAKVGALADEPLAFRLLAKALAATDTKPSVVVLNACESSAARKPLLKLGLIVISMRTSISDGAAVSFAQVFYAAIAAGQSVKAAFEQAKVAVEAASISERNTPQIFYPAGANAKIVLV